MTTHLDILKDCRIFVKKRNIFKQYLYEFQNMVFALCELPR